MARVKSEHFGGDCTYTNTQQPTGSLALVVLFMFRIISFLFDEIVRWIFSSVHGLAHIHHTVAPILEWGKPYTNHTEIEKRSGAWLVLYCNVFAISLPLAYIRTQTYMHRHTRSLHASGIERKISSQAKAATVAARPTAPTVVA